MVGILFDTVTCVNTSIVSKLYDYSTTLLLVSNEWPKCYTAVLQCPNKNDSANIWSVIFKRFI